MKDHFFILQPGIWLGEGVIAFSASKDTAKFYTRWKTVTIEPDKITCTQEVELHGMDHTMHNYFTFYEITATNFKVILENDTMGKVAGKGVIDDKTIAWELRDHPGMEGYEVYTLQESGGYTFHAEYSSLDNFRSIIDGKVWHKSNGR